MMASEEGRQRTKALAKIKDVRPIADYYAMLEKFPMNYTSAVKEKGGQEAYEAEKAERIKNNWTFSVNPNDHAVVIHIGADGIGRGTASY